jgi:hypothetical protein
MNATKERVGHTPGPWHTGEGKAATIVYTDIGFAICDAKVFHGRHGQGESNANARLLAAAPDLLEACETALENLSPLYCGDHLVITRLRAAIAKATGAT